jgi:hypothetical protein
MQFCSKGQIGRNLEVYIKVNKISAIAEIGQVRNVKDIQRLMGYLAALNCFISRLGECELPLYKLIKKFDFFRWMDEA